MHRTEGANHLNNKFTDGPPGTCVEENWLNAIQEEICSVIELNGIAVKTAVIETNWTQLYEAIGKQIVAAMTVRLMPAGAKVPFYQDAAPSGWTLDTSLNDKLIYVTKGSDAGGQVGGSAHVGGTWVLSGITSTSHMHSMLHTHTQGALVGAQDTFLFLNSGRFLTSGPSVANTGLAAVNSGGDGAWRPAAYCFIVCSKDSY